MRRSFPILAFCLYVSLTSCTGKPARAYDSIPGSADRELFDSLSSVRWKCAMKAGRDWRKDWFLDGERARVSSGKEGITFLAGPTPASDADHAVLWTRKSFSGDVRIEYDFTRLDSLDRFVDIIYIQAEGSGKDGYDRDIYKWCDRRRVPAMSCYFNNMNTLHVSYAAYENSPVGTNPHYIRARRYMPEWGTGLEGTDLEPEYLEPMVFVPGHTYHMTFIKRGTDIVFRVTDREGTEEYFRFSAAAFPPVISGRIGLRQMSARAGRYSGFRVYTTD